MIDQYFNHKGRRDPLRPDPDYQPAKAMADARVWMPLQARTNGRLQVMFSPWHPDRRFHGYEIMRQRQQGTTVLELESHVQAIEPNPPRVLESYKVIRERAAQEIDKIRSDFDHVQLFAASSGNVALSLVAGLQPDIFDKATMLAAGNNLAACVWKGRRTLLLRRELEAAGWDYDRLNANWQPLASSNNVEAFAGKPVTFVRSTSDLNIVPELQVAYRDELETAGAVLDERVSHLGHYATIGRALTRGIEAVN